MKVKPLSVQVLESDKIPADIPIPQGFEGAAIGTYPEGVVVVFEGKAHFFAFMALAAAVSGTKPDSTILTSTTIN